MKKDSFLPAPFSLIYRFLLIPFLITSCKTKSLQKPDILTVPAGNKFTAINIRRTTILPSGRFLTPAGSLIRITNDPFGMAISPDGKKAVTLHNGVFTIIDLETSKTLRVPTMRRK